jgi:universal stress protein A
MSQIFKHVLIPVDFSEDSELAAGIALGKFAADAETITIVTVCETRGNRHTEMPPEIDQLVIDNIKQRTSDFAERYNDKYKNLNTIIKKGCAATQILNTSQDMNIDLIVMGSQGRSSLARVFFGSTTYDVARKAKCSVFTIRT